ncbi:MAG TPA: type II toxin-antitoxin system HicB family antitoxin [Candidatus Nanoarchaeia archaeon]|nr:type II toxin-antitoxin system HicB family antitoxin [Candidatus Nanoarchaeia archaeon]
MEKKYFVDIVMTKEKLSDGSDIFVVRCPPLGIATQGKNVEEARYNIQEAIELYLEEQPDKYEELTANEIPLFSFIEVKQNAKAPNSIG